MCCIAIGAAAIFVVTSEQQICRSGARRCAPSICARAKSTDALADLRAAQQAYVAAGQGVAFWMPKVDATLRRHRQLAVDASAVGHGRGVEARRSTKRRATLGEFSTVDKRVRDYLTSGAAVDGGRRRVHRRRSRRRRTAARQVERARARGASGSRCLRSGAAQTGSDGAGGAGGLLLLVIAVLALMPAGRRARRTRRRPATMAGRDVRPSADAADDGLALRPISRPEPKPREPPPALEARRTPRAPTIKAAAQLCTDLGRVGDTDGVEDAARPRGRSARRQRPGAVDGHRVGRRTASGARARIRSPDGGAHSAGAALGRQRGGRRVQDRHAANRRWRVPDRRKGAIVAPLLSADGCIGVLSAEIRDGGEASETVQALAAIIAAQLAGVVASTSAPSEERPAGSAAM